MSEDVNPQPGDEIERAATMAVIDAAEDLLDDVGLFDDLQCLLERVEAALAAVGELTNPPLMERATLQPGTLGAIRITPEEAAHLAADALMERATLPAPDPEVAEEVTWAAYKSLATVAESWRRRAEKAEAEVERLAGLQAPPVDDEAVGWANRYPQKGVPVTGWGMVRPTAAKARYAAAAHAVEVAVPLYRRPGVQTPAADVERFVNVVIDVANDVAASVTGEGPVLFHDAVGEEWFPEEESVLSALDALIARLRATADNEISAGVQSPPATPEPERVTVACGRCREPLHAYILPTTGEVDGQWLDPTGWFYCSPDLVPGPGVFRHVPNLVPVPDPETETTDG